MEIRKTRFPVKFRRVSVFQSPPLWSSGQSSWLQIQIFRKVVGLERSLLSLVSTTEELLERISSGTGLGIRHADHVAPSIRKSWH
jgi:hypothetical protein